jgi:hypothetical protein
MKVREIAIYDDGIEILQEDLTGKYFINESGDIAIELKKKFFHDVNWLWDEDIQFVTLYDTNNENPNPWNNYA